jgi:hypothetical protein
MHVKSICRDVYLDGGGTDPHGLKTTRPTPRRLRRCRDNAEDDNGDCAKNDDRDNDLWNQDVPLAKIQRICAASAMESGPSAAALTIQVASLGAEGQHVRNVMRDFHRLIRRNLRVYVEPTYVEIPTSQGLVKWPILAPHETFAKLADLDLTKKILLGDLDPAEFWNRMKLDPCISSATAEAMTRASALDSVPIRLHGDEGQWLGRDRGVLILSLGGFVHASHPYDARMLICVGLLSLVMEIIRRHGLSLSAVSSSMSALSTSLSFSGTPLATATTTTTTPTPTTTKGMPTVQAKREQILTLVAGKFRVHFTLVGLF